MDRFKEYFVIVLYLEGGIFIEYLGYLVLEEGFYMVLELYRDGVLVIGDVVGFCINLGFIVCGMDFVIEFGWFVVEVVIKVYEIGDFSVVILFNYKKLIDSSFIMEDLN